MKKFLLWCLLCLWAVNQTDAALPDSLVHRLSLLEPEGKIDALLAFAGYQQNMNLKLAEEAGLMAWRLAQTRTNPLYKGKSALLLGNYYHSKAPDFRKSAYFYKKWIHLSVHETPKELAEVMMRLATAFLLEKELDSARLFAIKSASLFRLAGDEEGYASSRFLAGNVFLETKQPDSALACFALSADAIENLLKTTSPDDSRYRQYLTRMAEINGTLANTWILKGNYRMAAKEINKALVHAVLAGNQSLQVRLSLDYANIYARQGWFEKSLEILLKILKESEKQGKPDLLAEIWRRIGEIYAELGELEKSLQNLHKAIGLLNTIGNIAATAAVYAAMGDVYFRGQQYDSADACYSRSMEINRRFEHLNGLAGDLVRRGNLAMARGRLQEADAFFTEVLRLGFIKEPSMVAEAQKGLARLALKRGQTRQAIELALQAYEYAVGSGDLKNLVELSALLVDAYAAQGDYKNAFRWQQDHIAWSDSLNLMGHRKEIALLQARYDFEKKEAELELEKEKSYNLARTQRLILYFSVMGILLAIIIAWLLYRREKERRLTEALNYRRQAELARIRQALMEAEVKARELEQKQLIEDLKTKSAHLTNLALIIAQKNEFINQLREQIKSLRHADGDEREKCTTALLHRLSQQHRLNADLDRFRKEVEAAHQSFFRRLDEICPSLTLHEKELAGLLRIGLASKDIASLNNVSVKAVEMSRYRLRRKLNLSTDESLVDFLQRLL